MSSNNVYIGTGAVTGSAALSVNSNLVQRGTAAPSHDAPISTFFADETNFHVYVKKLAGTGTDKWYQIDGGSSTPGAAGMGPPGFDGADGEDAMMIPGPPGPAGSAGADGAPGAPGTVIMLPGWEGEDGEPGPPGVGGTGAAGASGGGGTGDDVLALAYATGL